MDPILEKYMILWADKANRHLAREHAENYVRANMEKLSVVFGDLSLKQMVEQVTFYRNVGREEDMYKAKMWLLANFEPQKIGGSGTVEVRRNL